MANLYTDLTQLIDPVINKKGKEEQFVSHMDEDGNSQAYHSLTWLHLIGHWSKVTNIQIHPK